MPKKSYQIQDYIGKKYGKLTVLKEVGRTENKRYLVTCQCDCGVIKDFYLNNILSKNTQSCGCQVISRFKLNSYPGQVGFNLAYNNYRYAAKMRKLSFDLTKDEFRNLVTQNCHYCGIKPNNIYKLHAKSASKEAQDHSKYRCNGIDRLDNKEGYYVGNCVPCCKTCNYLKRAINYHPFIEKIKNIYEHLITVLINQSIK